jgi:FtsP/CotA-like multicopper oxidase with cupredoxin domain
MSSHEHKETPTMRSRRPTRSKVLTLLAGLGALIALMTTSATGQLPPPTTLIDLCATDGTLSLPGGASADVWGFVEGATCVSGDAQVPGPVLDIPEGEVVQVTVHNNLAEPISFEVPGRAIEEGLAEAPAGGTATYTFSADDPGTYGYQSPSNAGRQIAMGLYGALIVRSATANQAYDDPASAYDGEAILVLSAVDPAFNADPDNFDMKNYVATYWLINGEAYPQADAIPAPAGQRRLLLRYVNAGYDNTSMMLLGMHEHVIARDAYALANPYDADAEIIPAGATEDAIATVPAASSGLPNGFPLYNRQLHITNGSPGVSPGGMLTFIVP